MSEEAKELPVEEKAAQDFHKLYPTLERLLGMQEVSKKGIARAVKSAVGFPLVDKYPKFIDAREEHLFQLIMHLMDCKMIMIKKVIEEKQKAKGEENGKREVEVAQSGNNPTE